MERNDCRTQPGLPAQCAESDPCGRDLRIFYGLLRLIRENRWQGACHAASAILYILYRECGMDAALCVGEVGFGEIVTDHSWVELDREICDPAIHCGPCGLCLSPPVFRGRELRTAGPAVGRYGIFRYGLGPVARSLPSTAVSEYMDRYPACEEGLWRYVTALGHAAGLDPDIGRLREKYDRPAWQYRRDGGPDER